MIVKKHIQQNILINFFSGIGNFILFIPALKAVCNKYPDATITLLTKQKGVSEIAQMIKFDNDRTFEYIDYSGIKTFFQRLTLLYELKNKYDMVVTTFDTQSWKLAVFVKAINGRLSIGYKANRWYDCLYSKTLTFAPNSNEVDRHLKIADYLQAPADRKECKLQISRQDEQCAKSIIAENAISRERVLIGMHPGSSASLFRKRWHPERFARVADILTEKYRAQIILFGGPEEVLLAEKIAALTTISKPTILAGKTNIRQTAAIISKCDLFISNDSGLMHISAAVNTPTIAIFGPTNPSKNSPMGDGHIVVRKELPCSPCLNYVEDRCLEQKCLEKITVQNVIDAVEKKLSSIMVAK